MLKSFKVIGKDGTEKDWQGGGAKGLLIYSAGGRMSVSINSNPESLKEVTDADSILKRSLFYAGTYRVNGSELLHLVEYATNPARIGETQRRQFVLEEPLLTLSASGDYGSSVIVWEKVSA